MADKKYKIFQIVPEMYPRIVQYNNGVYYDGSGNILNISNGFGSGSQGPQGPQSAQGLTGTQGYQGPQSTQGATGSVGATGTQGSIGFQGPQGETGATGATGTGLSYNFSTGLTVSGLTVSVDTSVIATVANLNTHFSNGGDSFGATATFGTIDNNNIQVILNNTLVGRFLTQSSNVTTGPGSSVFVIYGNTATASSVLGPTGTSMWIQGITTQAANTALLTTFNSGGGSGGFRPHIRMVNGAGQAASIGMIDNSQSIVFGRNSDTFLTLTSGASTFNVSASSAAQNSLTVQTSHQNSSGISVALLVNNTGSNSSTGGVTSFRVNNTETLGGSGTMSLIDTQRNSNTVFRIDMSGAISAGTVSNATQSSWKLGKVITTASSLDTTRYVEINIDGSIIKLAVIV